MSIWSTTASGIENALSGQQQQQFKATHCNSNKSLHSSNAGNITGSTNHPNYSHPSKVLASQSLTAIGSLAHLHNVSHSPNGSANTSTSGTGTGTGSTPHLSQHFQTSALSAATATIIAATAASLAGHSNSYNNSNNNNNNHFSNSVSGYQRNNSISQYTSTNSRI